MNRATRLPRFAVPRAATSPRFIRGRRGLGMVELMVSLAITSALLTATAVAVNASFKAYEINEEQSSLIQRSRIAMNHVLSVIRTCQAHSPDTTALATQFSSGLVVTDTGIDMYNASNSLIIFRYDSPNQRLLAITNGSVYTMAEGVTAFQVKMEPMRSLQSVKTGGPWDLLMRASVQITVKTNSKTSLSGETTGKQVVTLSGATMPRRNAW